MRRGFIFSYEFCVGCKSCSAACMLENGWDFRSRNIYSSNGGCFTPQPVINLSMACNHCNDPVCLTGCPSGAYKKNEKTGAVIIDPERCLGCRYCIWNCPYDAPKYNNSEGIIEKCHFCYHRLDEGVEPACSSSCPTGALDFGEIPESISLENYSWFPEKNINPSLLITGSDNYSGPAIIPEKQIRDDASLITGAENDNRKWSLVGFTYLTFLSVAMNVADMFSESSVNRIVAVALLAFAALFSMFHLGSKHKAWMAVGNLRSSPLSREIALFILYSVLVMIDQVTEFRVLGIIVAITGISLVIVIDSVYNFSEGKKAFGFHSGQALLTLMLMISFILDITIAFAFVAIIKIMLSVERISGENRRELFAFRFIRIAFLLISALIMITGTDKGAITSIVIFFGGELADRIIFYIDFKPANIKDRLYIKYFNIKNQSY